LKSGIQAIFNLLVEISCELYFVQSSVSQPMGLWHLSIQSNHFTKLCYKNVEFSYNSNNFILICRFYVKENQKMLLHMLVGSQLRFFLLRIGLIAFYLENNKGRFHQHFIHSFFIRNCFAQLFSVTFWLCNFLAQGYRQKIVH